MASQTEDPRIDEITSTTTYVLLYRGTEPLYVGSTARPLKRRLSEHKKEATRRNTPLYNALEELDLDEMTIHPIPLLSEKEALEHLSEVTLNAYETPGAEYEGPDWSSDMVDVLEDADTDQEAADRLDLPYHVCYDARRKLGVAEENSGYTVVDWSEWDDQLGTMTDNELAKKIGCTGANVTRRRNELGIEPFADRGGRRLDGDTVRAIWVRYWAYEEASYSSVAERFDVLRSTVGKIIRGDTYADIEKPSKVAIEAKKAYAQG
ncbi:hypothetical protein GGQ10_002110 [Salinibacter ruber]|uniref:hypothetical protein n=1 Tax=Salinibacter ruber TaxID=146919 RepID=UPI002166E9BD|nr:hypothetical protein [Salinibacter ruber]MCS4087284.1 hypothetical protein [Salinibacter ruber]